MARTGSKKGIRRVHSLEFRAAVMANLLAGQGVTEVAMTYKLPLSTVSRWRKDARAEAGKSEDIGELLLAYLRANLEALRAQLVVLRDPIYLREQSAGELAVLHGVLTDKAVRLLEAMEPSTEKPQ